jgi:hypothetical protein
MSKKKLTMLPIWTKFWNCKLEQRNKENRQENKVSNKYMCKTWNTKNKMQNIWKTENTKKITEPRPWPSPGPALGRQGLPGATLALGSA